MKINTYHILVGSILLAAFHSDAKCGIVGIDQAISKLDDISQNLRAKSIDNTQEIITMQVSRIACSYVELD